VDLKERSMKNPDLGASLEGISLDRASASIATRLMAQRSLAQVDEVNFSGSAPARHLAATANFEIAVTIALSNSVAQAAAMSSMGALKENPGAFGTAFAQFYAETCTKPCQGLPVSWEASSPSITQVYIKADQTSRVNTTTTTRPPPPPPQPPPPPSQEKFAYGIILGVSIGLAIVVTPIIMVALFFWRLKMRRASAVTAMPSLPPAPARQWEMPESAKMLGPNGEPLTGHAQREWQGGGTYEGQVKDGIRDGDGRMQWPNGKSFAGQWVGGRPHGHGLLHAPGDRGWTYNGQFHDGQRHGLGRCESLSRRIWYDGQWNTGVQSGMGENGNLPNLQVGTRTNIPPPVAHIWRMEHGEQNEHIAISKVAPDKQHLIGLALEATTEDYVRLMGSSYLPGGTKGPPESPLQMYSRLWGICFGRPDDWLPSSWGALVITRIMDDGALARWNVWHVRDMGGEAHAIEPNALIWRVNGVEGDIGLMAQELSAEDDRRRLQLAISNPPHVRFQQMALFKKGGGPTQVPGGMPALPSAPQTLFLHRGGTWSGDAGAPGQPSSPQSPKRSRRGRSTDEAQGPLGTLRRTALEDLATSALADVPMGTLPAPPHAPPPGTRQTQFNNLPSLPALPDIPGGRQTRMSTSSAMSAVSTLPALPGVPPHLGTASLPPPPPNMPAMRPPPGRPLTPGEMPHALAGPPPKVPGPPARIGYRAVAAATRAARAQGLPDPRQQQLHYGHQPQLPMQVPMQEPDPPG